ncbi:hypothetical protein D3C77_684590 [compost metagenome]
MAGVAGGQRLDQAQQQPAGHGPEQVADAAQHRRREGLEPQQQAHVGVGLAVVDRAHYPGDGAQAGTDEEGGADHPVDVDAHQPGHLLVLRGGTHGLAQPGLVHQQP